MGFWTVFVIAVGLSMDAFAVSVANGCRMTRVTLRDALRPGWWFGGFQMLMPVLGWLGGLALQRPDPELQPLGCIWSSRFHRRQDACRSCAWRKV